MEIGGPLVLKLMLEIMMDVDDSALRVLTQSLQMIRLKDLPGEYVCTRVSYLKEAFLLLQNNVGLITDIMGLLNNIMGSADCNKFSSFMDSAYFHKRKICIVSHQKFFVWSKQSNACYIVQGNRPHPKTTQHLDSLPIMAV